MGRAPLLEGARSIDSCLSLPSLAPRRPSGVRHSLPHGRNRTRKASYGIVYWRCGPGEKRRNKLNHPAIATAVRRIVDKILPSNP